MADGEGRAGSGEDRGRRPDPAGCCRPVEVEGYEVLIGKGARENDELTFRVASPRDLWLHVAGQSGSHVVLRVGEAGDPPRTVVERAAELAAWHSKARNAGGKVTVHLCRVADVTKRRGAPPGQVQLRRWDALKVYPRGES
jgi:predicted ribosome quality control (RQC) complex YloA/Tae2 family protein